MTRLTRHGYVSFHRDKISRHHRASKEVKACFSKESHLIERDDRQWLPLFIQSVISREYGLVEYWTSELDEDNYLAQHGKKKIQAMIMVPTRELALQTSQIVMELSKHIGLKVRRFCLTRDLEDC